MPREMTGQRRDCSRLLISRQISSLVFTPDDRPDAVVRRLPQDLVILLQGHADRQPNNAIFAVLQLMRPTPRPTLNRLLSERPP
jgi:hypothetical protein